MKYRGNRPCPEHGKWKLIKTKEGSFWRRERGTGGKEAVLNDGYAASRDLLKMLSPLAASFVRELRPHMIGLSPGRITLRVKSCLQESLKMHGGIDYRYFRELDFQPDYPLRNVLKVEPKLECGKKFIELHVPIPEGGAVERQSGIVTDYRFVLVMLAGDPFADESIVSYSAASTKYELEKAYPEGCDLKLMLPEGGKPWLAMLRIVTFEGHEMAYNARHSGMKVVGWNAGF